MSEITWIKLATSLPDNKKIKQIRTLPEGDTLVLLWVFLLCLAGDTNDEGLIYLAEGVPYTDEMLATQFGIDVNTIRLGIRSFTQFRMLETVNGVLAISNWGRYQATDKLSETRAYNRNAQRKHREKQRLLTESTTVNDNVNDMSMTCQPCQGTEVEVDKEIDKDKEGGKERKEPTAAEVADYCREINATIDADRFVSYYSQKNWTVGGKPIDWKAQVRKWAETEYPKKQTVKHFQNQTPEALMAGNDILAEHLAQVYGQPIEEVFKEWQRK